MSGIGCHNTSKMAAQSYLKDINQSINILFGSVCILLKIKCKVSPYATDYLFSRNPKTNGTAGPPPGKSSYCNTSYVFCLTEAFKRKPLKWAK